MLTDFSPFLNKVFFLGQSLGLFYWFNTLALSLILLSFVWAVVQFVYGNRLGAQAGVVRAVIATLLYTAVTYTNSGGKNIGVRGTLWYAWKTGYYAVHNQVMQGPMQKLGEGLRITRDITKTGILVGGALATTTAVYTIYRSYAGLKAVRNAKKAADELKSNMGGRTRTSGGNKIVEGISRGVRGIVYIITGIQAAYIATVITAGVLAYFTLALLPLGVGLYAIGYGRLTASLLSGYIAALMLGIAAPIVTSACITLVTSQSVGKINQKLRDAVNQAEELHNQQAQTAEQIRQNIQNLPDPTQNQQKSYIDRAIEWFNNTTVGKALADAKKAIDEKINSVVSTIDQAITGFSTWVVTGLASVVLYALTFIGVIYGAKAALEMLASTLRGIG